MSIQTLQWIMWAVGLSLQYLVLAGMAAGAWRTYVVAFTYVILLITATVTDIAAFFVIDTKARWVAYYWTAELVRQTAMFAVVTDLAVRMAARGRARRTGTLVLIGIAALYWAGSIVFLRQPDVGEWMTRVVRNLSFGAAVVNLALWFRLISQSERDARDLAIAGGLGLQMTGEAMGQSVRSLFPSLVYGGNLIIVFGHYLCMLVWWQAFARERLRLPGRAIRQNTPSRPPVAGD
jgi:hypothetical protein